MSPLSVTETRIRLIAEAIDSVCSLINFAKDAEISVLVTIATRQVEVLLKAERQSYTSTIPYEIQKATSDFLDRVFNSTIRTHTIGSAKSSGSPTLSLITTSPLPCTF